MTTISKRLREARDDLQISQEDLAARAGVSPGTIGNIEAGTRKEPRKLVEIATALQVNPSWLKLGRGAKRPLGWAQSQSPGPAPPSEGMGIHPVDQDLSHPRVEDELLTHPWEFVLSAGLPLPKRFCTAVPDDALAPRSPRGTEFVFSSTFTGTPDDSVAVIVQTAGGRRYMRLYFAQDGAAWEARARDPAVPVLHSDRDGLQLLAVAVFRPGGQA